MYIVSVRINKRFLSLAFALFFAVAALLFIAHLSGCPVSAPQTEDHSVAFSEDKSREEHYPGEPMRVIGKPDEYWEDQLSALE